MTYKDVLLGEDDIPELLKLAEEIGWGYNKENWIQFFRLGTAVGHRTDEGKLASSAVMIKYGDSLHWLTSFIVSPMHQRRGLAGKLWTILQTHIASDRTPFGLISTDEGLPFYRQLGCEEVSTVEKYVCKNGLQFEIPDFKAYSISTATDDDLPSLNQLDEMACGVRRYEMLGGKITTAKKAVKLVDSKNSLRGFSIATMEGRLLCIGPVVSPDQKTAAALILASAKSHDGPIRLDLVPQNVELADLLKKSGFSLERTAPVMRFRGNPLPILATEYRAIAAQALG